ncbi:hypothetical protein P7C70_g6568, partial [Phenoliferia sp. Uapishka_3]
MASSFNNGLYTPDTTAPDGAVMYTTTQSTVWWTPPVTSVYSPAATTTSPFVSVLQLVPTSQTPPTAAIATSATTSPPTSPPTSPQTSIVIALASPTSLSSSTSSFSGSGSTTLSRPSIASDVPSPISHSAFKISYLIPAFVILPIIFLLLILGYTYGRCWGKRRYWATHGSAPGSGRGRQNEWSAGILSPEEEGGLVEGKWVGEDHNNEKRWMANAERPGSRWGNLKRIVSHSPSVGHSGDADGFAGAAYRPLDDPFAPPLVSALSQRPPQHAHGDEAMDDERGWGWGTQQQAAQSRSGGKIEGEAGPALWTRASRKYRARSASSRSIKSNGGTTRSRGLVRSDTLMSRISQRLFGESMPSPSVYSSTGENSPYAGCLEGVDEDDDDPARHNEKLDAMLADSRVGNGDLARRYMSGDTTTTDFALDNPYSDQVVKSVVSRPYQNDGFRMSVDLPSAPRPSHVSPKKSALVRPTHTLSQTSPIKSNPLLFSYDSPPANSSYTALPTPRSATRRPFPRSAASIPALNTPTTPPSRTTSADSSSLSPFGNSSSPPRKPTNVGSPMPAYEPKPIRASESSYSLSGVRGLVYGDEPESTSHSKVFAPAHASESKHVAAPADKPAWIKIREPTVPGTISYVKTPPSRAKIPPSATAPSLATPSRPSKSPRRKSLTDPEPTADPFNPIFTELAPLPRLNHPSRVRAAVEDLETRSTGAPPSPVLAPPFRPSPATATPPRVLQSRGTEGDDTERPTSLIYSRPVPNDEERDSTDGVRNLLLKRSRASLAGDALRLPDPDVIERQHPKGPRAAPGQTTPSKEPDRLPPVQRRTPEGGAGKAETRPSPTKTTGNPPSAHRGVRGPREVGLQAMVKRSAPAPL